MHYASRKENVTFEAKACTDKLPDSFWPTYSSFANTFGGTIVLGLSEDKDSRKLIPTGVKDPERIVQNIWNLVNNPQKVSVNLLSEKDVSIIEQDGVKLIKVEVPRAERRIRPVYINGSIQNGTYKRNGEGDYHCSSIEVSEMIRESTDVPVDSTVCGKVLLKDLDERSVESYRNMMSARLPAHPWNKKPNDDFLRLIGAADFDENGVLKPTLAGLLMFGFDYSIERELPRYMLDYMEFSGDGREWSGRMTTDTGEWSGNLFEFYTYVANRLNWNGSRAFELKGTVRVDDSEILKAEREAVLNAIAHADYNGSGGVRVELRPDILRVRNPGTFRIPINMAESGGHSDPRNPSVMKMFMLLGLVERAGSGVQRMIDACREMGLGVPVIKEGTDPSTVTVEMRIAAVSYTKAATPSILEYLSSNGNATIREIAEATGMSTSTVSRRIKELRDDGRLIREGGKAHGTWRVTGGPDGSA